ncbi:chemotaxis protein CheA [Burkholderia glumae]|uniref:histidine kinase n=2 Tax=Burkholderia glumae TaxID=337 RepID=A0ABY5B6D2_BURGL|nr:chemotaxis protein CheA [Burkholderia glumae]ACR32312.1 CheA signal transduction histidine kinase [Burkholderia glumae BGR1]AJY62930.1 cheW-like domain protein [Burkholderia glumae LMG 2196 = ATCC 33617]KHJ61812.1 chemotaxis protein CheA [Burkholderia glumae]MCM2484497.1 chemotaxis protein CheA [Burkholderia glumae]MCM2510189.1 chemotaxis protein CheA [Burkholderia glumae]
MTPLLAQFIAESRDILQSIGRHLIDMELAPDDGALMNELFRLLHTLKGNSGLFELPGMTRLLHTAEDLMDAVRNGRVAYSRELADTLLEAMDEIAAQLDALEQGAESIAESASTGQLGAALQALSGGRAAAAQPPALAVPAGAAAFPAIADARVQGELAQLPEALRMRLFREACAGARLRWIVYQPEPDCFFRGEDPLHLVRQIPDTRWMRVRAPAPWTQPAELDIYRCQIVFHALSGADGDELDHLFRYVAEQVVCHPLPAAALVWPPGQAGSWPDDRDFPRRARALLDGGDTDGLRQYVHAQLARYPEQDPVASTLRWLDLALDCAAHDTALLRHVLQQADGETQAETAIAATPLSPTQRTALRNLIEAQRDILRRVEPLAQGALQAIGATLSACCAASGEAGLRASLGDALASSVAGQSAQPLLGWLQHHADRLLPAAAALPSSTPASCPSQPGTQGLPQPPAVDSPDPGGAAKRGEDGAGGARVLKVDQARIDRLMDLIGEIVVAKNGLPYLASRADEHYGVRELGREIKAQYAVINRIAEELQDAIMQVRMLPLSFIFQRFPRLVRDISRKLGKEVELVIEGDETEADKNIVEALADPLIHILRNSLDHGLETPQQRIAAGKPAVGRLLIRAQHEADRVLIDVSDDGRGIDPQAVKRKAYSKGLISEAALESLSDVEAQRLVFTPGFSTAEVVSDLSGRGVGMDAVRSAVEKVNGSIALDSTPGRGTRLRLTLPLSMAVSNVMIIETGGQIFGVPMDQVVETVRVPQSVIRTIKQRRTAVLRDRIVPLVALNDLLALDAAPRPNADDELATLVVRLEGEHVGILVDEFRVTTDIILKPMSGVLAGLGGYAGSALLGDGSVLIVLNPKELL